jgi:hypothetical protein
MSTDLNRQPAWMREYPLMAPPPAGSARRSIRFPVRSLLARVVAAARSARLFSGWTHDDRPRGFDALPGSSDLELARLARPRPTEAEQVRMDLLLRRYGMWREGR